MLWVGGGRSSLILDNNMDGEGVGNNERALPGQTMHNSSPDWNVSFNSENFAESSPTNHQLH